jgi:hypothetical protein
MARALVKNSGQAVRNLLINGNFDFWQRGVSDATSGTNYLADRFSQRVSAGTVTWTRDTDTPDAVKSSYSSKWTVTGTGGGGGVVETIYKMEGSDWQEIAGRDFSIVFYAKSSVAGTYSLACQNTGQNRAYVTTYTLLANTWTQVIVNIPAAPAAGTWDYLTGIGLRIHFRMNGTNESTSSLNQWITTGGIIGGATTQTNWSGTNGATFQLSQVMVIPNTVSTLVPFARSGRTIQDELAMCQRYCVNYGQSHGNNWHIQDGFAVTTTHWYGTLKLPTTMRAIPTLTSGSVASDFDLYNGAEITCSVLPVVNGGGTISTDTFSIDATVAAGLTVGAFYVLRSNNVANASLIFSAEL